MGCQVEPLFTQYEIKGIVVLISRPLPTDELNHVVSETNQLLDCVGLETGDGSISFVNPNRDSPNGYPTVTPAELQPVTLAH